jgi:DNA repair exonuclease SbcCD ATPase subunit
VIPLRVKLKGFLCYVDEQEVAFDGSSLWMLSGLNGSGKSSIFDALTYALFGHHRGGSQHAHELINKDSDGLVVEFDFTLDGAAYRIKRTLRRNARGGATGTHLILRYQTGSNGNGHGTWEPVPETGKKTEFDGWVRDNVGLTYETFTSSVLLLQGQAEKLLGSKPEERRTVLANIVDLERYERLHRLADDRRKELEADLKQLSQRLSALPPVEPLELAAAENCIQDAEKARARAREEVERLHKLEDQAQKWGKLQGRLTAARERHDQALALVHDKDAIETKLRRLAELREVLPHLHNVTEQRTEAHKAEARIRDLREGKDKLTEALTRADHALKQARDKRTSLQNLVKTDEERLRTVKDRLLKATGQMANLKEYERQDADLAKARDDLARLPADPVAELKKAQAKAESLTTLAHVVPMLERLVGCRDKLRTALEQEQTVGQTQKTIQARGEQLKAEGDRLRAALEEAVRAAKEAADQETEARVHLQWAKEGLQELSELDGAKTCRHCGQALTEKHLQDEKKRRGTEVAENEGRHKNAVEAMRTARAKETKQCEECTRTEKTLVEARVEYSEAANELKQAKKEVERLGGECRQIYADLPNRFRSCIGAAPPADWLATTYPTADDLDAARSEADGLGPARKAVREAEAAQQHWATLKAREAAALQTLNRLQTDLPADRQVVRREYASLEADDKSLEKNLLAKRGELELVGRDLDRLTKEQETVKGQIARADADLDKQDLILNQARRTIDKALKELPASWRPQAERIGMSELFALKNERDVLQEQGTDERGKALQQARLNLEVLEREKAALEAEQETFPAAARQDPAALQVSLADSRAIEKTCDEELMQARRQKDLLDDRRQQREQIGQEMLFAEQELTTQKLLAELLGRDRLQLHLVRQAERQVVDHSNAVLDRLSGGQLYLRLVGEANGEGSSAKALDLEAYNRATGERPINVAFLSGSQKFRVAVSLALGIGQYASRQHRPIESVIIDEGFGCLDRQGRQVMIQELQNLRGQMRCILLVSHQEEFADAFADGYHFQLESGATKVTRFQR